MSLGVLPVSVQRPRDPSEYLPVSTYSPEPNEQWVSQVSSKPASHNEAQTDGLAGWQLVVADQMLPTFETRPIKTQIPSRASAPPTSDVPTSPPTQYDASINELERRLSALSTPNVLCLSRAETSMTELSAALLARQINDSRINLGSIAPQIASYHPVPFSAESCGDSSGPKASGLLPRPPEGFSHELHSHSLRPYLEDSSRAFNPNNTDAISGRHAIGPQTDTDMKKTSSTAITWQQRDRPTEMEEAIFELAATDAIHERCTSWQAIHPLNPSILGSHNSTMDGAYSGGQSRYTRMNIESGRPPRHLTWPIDHPASRSTQPGTRCWSTLSSTVSHASGKVPYCATAWNLQLGQTRDDWQSQFTFAPGSFGMVCNSCKSRIPTQIFKIRCKYSIWQVSERLMARCHKPSLLPNGNAQLGCVFCPVDQPTFRSRNEFWAHLETHSAITYESDADIVEAILDL